MSFVFAAPEIVASAASDLNSLGSTIQAAHAAAAGPTTGIVAAAGDEVSAAIARLFGGFTAAPAATAVTAATAVRA
jgi:hypothetical protein